MSNRFKLRHGYSFILRNESTGAAGRYTREVLLLLIGQKVLIDFFFFENSRSDCSAATNHRFILKFKDVLVSRNTQIEKLEMRGHWHAVVV